MAKRMLIDAAHPEETRVAVVTGHRLEEFDFESSTKKQVKANIYLAKVTRVEPSLQAAFIDYGGNRHGFLAFSEIHPDYYRIPVSDREAGDAHAETAEAREIAAEDGEESGVPLAAVLPEPVRVPDAIPSEEETAEAEEVAEETAPLPDTAPAPQTAASPWDESETSGDPWSGASAWEMPTEAAAPWTETARSPAQDDPLAEDPGATAALRAEPDPLAIFTESPQEYAESEAAEIETVETLGGDEFDEAETETHRSRPLRSYKIQEVVKRRQIMLVQVSKEERGNKGAALTTYLSLAGRYCVLMPNTGRGGGVSRKITSLIDRRRLKEILEDLNIPEGMGVIVRTAGAERSKAEIKRDYEYLLRLWNEIRDMTLHSTAPALIYEEGNLIKRSIRDLYTRDIDEVLVEGEEGYRTAKAFMKMLMPSHARRVQPYRDPQIGLFHRFQVESQIDAIHSPIVQLRSGGYLVINQTEALVAIDVNSGRATRERNIEETALRTNLEAAEEIARQLRLRDLAGLIVIDFIDMEEHRNQSAVERRLKEALKSDRARIQVGRISPFGLLEMSRQRLRPSLAEASTQPCPHCGGTGFIRSTESTALYVLRSIEEEGIRHRSAEICVYVPTLVALYVLNQKRDSLTRLEARYGLRVLIARDDALIPPAFRLERLRPYGAGEAAVSVPAPLTQAPVLDEEDEEDEELAEMPEEVAGETDAPALAEDEEERARGRRPRRRRRRRSEPGPRTHRRIGDEERAAGEGERAVPEARADPEDRSEEDSEAEARHRRRGRRGGRRRARHELEAEPGGESPRPAADTIEALTLAESVAEDVGEGESLEDPPAQPAEIAVAWSSADPASAIEAASLPAFAGDDAPPLAEQPAAASLAAEVAFSERMAENPSDPPPLAETTEIVPFSGGGEALATDGGQPAPAPAQPPLPVQTITEKPANPRRGWWQRAPS